MCPRKFRWKEVVNGSSNNSNWIRRQVPGPIAALAEIFVTVTAIATVYSAASGGLPFDLASVLNQAGGSQAYLSLADVIGIIPQALAVTIGSRSAIGGLTLGTPTYGPASWPYSGGSPGARPNQVLATYPAWIRVYSGSTGLPPAWSSY